jgi:glycerol transport system permease protein
VPLSVWILEGFFSAVPTALDEMAAIDGHRFGYFFTRVFLPINRGALGVTLFFCFMFSWVELLLARTLSGSDSKPIVVVMTRTVSASGLDWGVLAAAGALTVVPGILVVWFVRKHLVKGFALGRVS